LQLTRPAAGLVRARSLQGWPGARLPFASRLSRPDAGGGAISTSVFVALAAIALGSASIVMPAAAAVAGTAAIAVLHSRIKSDFRARNLFERFVLVMLAACSGVAILATIGIVFSVLIESLAFFSEVQIFEFLFGTQWSPTADPPSFGFIPLLAGTPLITAIAILVAARSAPLGHLHG
jgi:phosphate transport system permease protein